MFLTFISSSSGPLEKQIQELSIFQLICFPRGSEDDLIKVETCRPDNIIFVLYIKSSVVLLTNTLYLYVITLRDGKH